jgi:hypothetical protein
MSKAITLPIGRTCEWLEHFRAGVRLGAVATDREERLARNEALFRAANERMADWDEIHGEDARELYFCECANPACREKVSLRKADYERVRANRLYFFVKEGHEIPDVETVIARNEGWSVIEKDPDVEEVVESHNPRRD